MEREKSAATTLPYFPESIIALSATYSGQKRRHWPTRSTFPARFAAASMRSQDATSSAIGFSQNTWQPAFSAAMATSGWSGVGSVTSTASNPPAASIFPTSS